MHKYILLFHATSVHFTVLYSHATNEITILKTKYQFKKTILLFPTQRKTLRCLSPTFKLLYLILQNKRNSPPLRLLIIARDHQSPSPIPRPIPLLSPRPILLFRRVVEQPVLAFLPLLYRVLVFPVPVPDIVARVVGVPEEIEVFGLRLGCWFWFGRLGFGLFEEDEGLGCVGLGLLGFGFGLWRRGRWCGELLLVGLCDGWCIEVSNKQDDSVVLC